MSLADEIKDDPLGLGYAAHLPGDPQRVVDLMTALTCTMVKTRYVTARTIIAECADGADILDKLQALAAQISDVKWMMVFLQQDSGMDAGHPRTLAKLDALVGAGAMPAAFAEQLKMLAIQPASRADVLGIPAPSARDIIDALKD